MSELFRGHGWRIVLESASRPNGKVKEVARVERVDSVHILAFPSDGKVLMLREFRPYYGTYIWMLPSGRADKENDMEAAAQRELREETGFQAGELTYFCNTNHSESILMTNHLFLAKNLTPAPLPQDDFELMEVHTLTVQDALDKVLASEKVHTASAFGLLRYLREHGSS